MYFALFGVIIRTFSGISGNINTCLPIHYLAEVCEYVRDVCGFVG